VYINERLREQAIKKKNKNETKQRQKIQKIIIVHRLKKIKSQVVVEFSKFNTIEKYN